MKWQFMMVNYKIVDFIALAQRLTENLTIFYKSLEDAF